MAIELSNGLRLALWDQQENENPNTFAAGESAFVTILEPGGSVALTFVIIQEGQQEGDRFDSVRSGITYPKRWSVRIPAKQVTLSVELLTDDQEIIPIEELGPPRNILTPRLEGKAAVEGTYEGRSVQGNAFVECFNLFPAFDALRGAE
jgi:predicted secreted hydrolase